MHESTTALSIATMEFQLGEQAANKPKGTEEEKEKGENGSWLQVVRSLLLTNPKEGSKRQLYASEMLSGEMPMSLHL